MHVCMYVCMCMYVCTCVHIGLCVIFDASMCERVCTFRVRVRVRVSEFKMCV